MADRSSNLIKPVATGMMKPSVSNRVFRAQARPQSEMYVMFISSGPYAEHRSWSAADEDSQLDL